MQQIMKEVIAELRLDLKFSTNFQSSTALFVILHSCAMTDESMLSKRPLSGITVASVSFSSYFRPIFIEFSTSFDQLDFTSVEIKLP